MSDESVRHLPAAPSPGTRIGPYVIESPVGSGGVATVFRARDESPEGGGRTVALKLLHPSRISDEDVRRFTREYRALARMDHPNIVRVFEAGVHEGYPWIAMEYVEGRDLDSLVHRWAIEHPVDRFKRVEHILRGLCAGLAYMHDLGLIHRDFKPSNVLVREDGTPKISDLGVVKDESGSTTNLTVAGRLIGTVAFMAPEQITGDDVDARADLYSLGVALYVMLTSCRPIEASSVAGYLARHLTEVPRPASELDPTVPPRLDRICQRLLMKEPAQRYASARAVLDALDREETSAPAPARGRETEIQEWNQRLSTLLKGGGGCVALQGPPGSGRTHLLRVFLDLAAAQGLNTVVGTVGTRDLTRTLLAEMADSTDPGTATWRKAQLDALAQPPGSVVAIDDLDRASARDISDLGQILRELVGQEGAPLLVLFTAADLDGVVAPLMEGTLSGLPAEPLELGPLDRRAVSMVLRDRGVQGAVAAALSKRLYDDHRGNIGSILEQLDALLDAHWMERAADGLRPTRPVEAFRTEPLPVPPRVRNDAEIAIQSMDSDSLSLIETLAVIDRAVHEDFLVACSGLNLPDVESRIEGTIRAGLLRRTGDDASDPPDDATHLRFSHPGIAELVRRRMPPEQRRERHRSVAQSLARRRRREATVELAHHLIEAGEPAAAYPVLAQAARAAARAGRWGEALTATARARTIRTSAELKLETREAARLLRTLACAEGETHLARGGWEEAVAPLEEALATPHVEGDENAVVRAKGMLGRVFLHLGRHDRAKPLLEAAESALEPASSERAAAMRALADLEMRAGQLDRAERLLEASLEISEGSVSRDAEARARRGLAHLRALQNRWDDASRQLDLAEDLVAAGGDPRVRAAILARGIELDLAAGRYGAAKRRSELLLELVEQEEMPERAPEAWSLHAAVEHTVGNAAGAADAVRHALSAARSHPSASARVRAARVLADTGDGTLADDALKALPRPEEATDDPIEDLPAQIAALRARLLARTHPSSARDLALWAASRPAPKFTLRQAQIAIDAGSALLAVRVADRARALARDALRALPRHGGEGVTLDVLLALQHGAVQDKHRGEESREARIQEAALRFIEGIGVALPEDLAASFRTRPDIAAVLAATSRPG